MNEPPTPPQNDASPQWYWYVVSALLIVMIGCLAFLWLNERSRTRAAEAQLENYRTNIAAFLQRSLSTVKPLQPEERQSREATVDGQRRKVVAIDSATGGRLGFMPGEVVIVGSEVSRPASSPSSQPAQ